MKIEVVSNSFVYLQDFHACHIFPVFLALSSPFCSHESKKRKNMVSASYLGMNEKFSKKYSSLRFAMWNQNAILFHHHLFPLVANHKKVTLLGSQKERRKEICKQTVQTKFYKLSKQNALQTVQTTAQAKPNKQQCKLNQTKCHKLSK